MIKKDSLKRKINESATYFEENVVRKLGGHIHEINNGYQPKSNCIKGTKSDACADSVRFD
jgi:hypothetical protein